MQEVFFGWEELINFTISAVVAVLCGVIIGLERESKGKPAGLRTLVLICLGSTIFVQASILLAGGYGDPARVAAQIVTGIGFLGAGAILQNSEQGFVAGLTTAASIWVTAAIGMVVGSGHYLMAVAGVSIVVMVLRFMRGLEGYLFYGSQVETKTVYFQSAGGKTRWILTGLLEDNLIRPDEYSFFREDSEQPYLELKFVHKSRKHRALLADIAALPQIIEMK